MATGISIILLYNRANQIGLHKDAMLLEEAFKKAGSVSVRHMDPREVPMPCDILVHLEIPYYGWIPYARYTIMMVNPEWWVSEAYDPYIPAFDLMLFKNEEVKDLFQVVCRLEEAKYAVVPWCCGAFPRSSETIIPSREFLYLVGGSVNKAVAAKNLVSIWKPSYPTLHIYTPRTDFEFHEGSATNVKVYRKTLEPSEVLALQRAYFGHCCASIAEGFGLTAAEAEAVGAFTLLNHNDAYDAAYAGDNYVRFLPTVPESNDKTRSTRSMLDLVGSVEVLDAMMPVFLNENITTTCDSRREISMLRRRSFNTAIAELLNRAVAGLKPPRVMPPLLKIEDCPPVSVITLVYNRRKFWDLALHNMMITDYPRGKLEWVIVDDSDDMSLSISDKIAKIQNVLPGLNVVYVPYHEKLTIGGKRNLGVKRATHDILLMMDDDDHYPETSFRRRVAYLSTEHGCAVCTTIALYDLQTGVSAVNVPPYDLPLGKRISEATLTFRRSFFMERKFEKISMAEGEPFIAGRELAVIEMMPQQIIVSFCHSTNSSTRRIPPTDVKPACFWGFPPEFLKFVHGLAGLDLQLTDLPATTQSTPHSLPPRSSTNRR